MSDLFKFPYAPLARDKKDSQLPKDGDGVIVLRSDGTAEMLLLGMEPRKLLEKASNGEQLSETESAHIAVANRVLALYFAASNPQIMEMLAAVASDPDVLTPELLASLPTLN